MLLASHAPSLAPPRPAGDAVDPVPPAGATSPEAALRLVAPRLLRVRRGVLGPGPDAEDATQESLIALVQALPGFRGESSLATFATRIALRTAWRVRERRAQRAQRTSSIDEGSDGVVRGSIAPDAVSTAAELRLIVMSLLGVLPTAQAEALLLRFVLGHSLQEIAEISGAPLNTVRSRIRLAREALQRRLAHDDRLRALVEEDDHV
ncbi:MAG: RNA polymerase sigma factor [Myxococcales bacterium]|nr:RNA polymerase sigma factor [Myxococcales bacterium]